jgi:muramoyltetrapeptide carboxypeptidase
MPRIKPRALRPGDTIGVVSPSSYKAFEALRPGIEKIQRRGYKLVFGEHAFDRRGYLAGEDRDRAADLNAMFAREDVKAVLCTRGGYGASRILDYLDWDTIRAHPKPLIGYSDITTLHIAFLRYTDMVVYHAPMIITLSRDVSEHAIQNLFDVLEKPEPPGTYDTREGNVQTLVPGIAEGELTGGCLCLVTATCGTPEQIDAKGKILCIEDVDEAPYAVDRMLTQLKRCGVLDEAAGFVIGEITDWQKHVSDPAESLTIEQVWQDIIVPLGKPAIIGFPFGHVVNPLTLPLGVQARLDATAGTLTLLEPAVSEA